MSFLEASIDWYKQVYLRAMALIQERNLLEDFPQRTEADLFIWVWWLYKDRYFEATNENFLLAARQAIEMSRQPWWAAITDQLKKWMRRHKR
jgi:hypothetical protein